MGWWSNLFGPSHKTLYCPYCQEAAEYTAAVTACPLCKAVLPPLFYATADDMPVLSIPLIGWTGCGKTVALEAMFDRLTYLTALWPGFTVECLSDETLRWSRGIRQDLARHRLPKSTHDEVQRPYPFALSQMRRWRGTKFHGRTLVVRDYPGEAFRELNIKPDQMAHIAKARVVMMMFCLSDLLDPAKNTNQNVIHELLQSYLFTLRKMGVDVKARRPGVVVVLSQTDRLLSETDFPGHLRDYVHEDPVVRAVKGMRRRDNTEKEKEAADGELDAYVKAMKHTSKSIGRYLLDKQPAAMSQLTAMAANNGVRLEYCLVSALGHEPDRFYEWPSPETGRSGRLLQDPIAYRVLDPLFMALELERVM
jgi:uncharacterized protein (DUF983 family)